MKRELLRVYEPKGSHMNSFNLYQFTSLQAQILLQLLAEKFLTELKRTAHPRPSGRAQNSPDAHSDPALVVDLSSEAREILKYKKAPYLKVMALKDTITSLTGTRCTTQHAKL